MTSFFFFFLIKMVKIISMHSWGCCVKTFYFEQSNNRAKTYFSFHWRRNVFNNPLALLPPPSTLSFLYINKNFVKNISLRICLRFQKIPFGTITQSLLSYSKASDASESLPFFNGSWWQIYKRVWLVLSISWRMCESWQKHVMICDDSFAREQMYFVVFSFHKMPKISHLYLYATTFTQFSKINFILWIAFY